MFKDTPQPYPTKTMVNGMKEAIVKVYKPKAPIKQKLLEQAVFNYLADNRVIHQVIRVNENRILLERQGNTRFQAKYYVNILTKEEYLEDEEPAIAPAISRLIKNKELLTNPITGTIKETLDEGFTSFKQATYDNDQYKIHLKKPYKTGYNLDDL